MNFEFCRGQRNIPIYYWISWINYFNIRRRKVSTLKYWYSNCIWDLYFNDAGIHSEQRNYSLYLFFNIRSFLNNSGVLDHTSNFHSTFTTANVIDTYCLFNSFIIVFFSTFTVLKAEVVHKIFAFFKRLHWETFFVTTTIKVINIIVLLQRWLNICYIYLKIIIIIITKKQTYGLSVIEKFDDIYYYTISENN